MGEGTGCSYLGSKSIGAIFIELESRENREEGI